MPREEELRQQLYDAFKNRAVLYYLIFDELRKELGADRAEEILQRAIYRRGAQKGAKYARFAPDDLLGLEQAFLAALPDDGEMFKPLVLRDNAEGLDIKFQDCPLRNAWQELGLPPEEIATLCRIAARIDNGTFESAGFEFFADTWEAGDSNCCHLHIRPGKTKSGADPSRRSASTAGD